MRIEQLTFTRFIAAIFIFIFHYGRFSIPFSHPVIFPFLKQANVGVSYFFILSGFVMVIAYSKSKQKNIAVKKFYASRFARIYPVYLIAILLSAAFLLIKKEVFSPTAFVLEIFALQSWVLPYALDINYTAWSISVELCFFLIFPFLFNLVYKKYTLGPIAIWAVVLWLVTQIGFNVAYTSSVYKGFLSPIHCFLYYHPIMHLNEFIVGNVTGLVYLNYFSQEERKRNFDIPLLGMPFLLLLFLHYSTANYHDGLLAVLFVPFIVMLSMNKGWLTTLFSKPIFVLLGEISYSIYILQLPVYWACKSFFIVLKIDVETYSLFYATAIALLCSAYISYRFIETPLRVFLNKKMKEVPQVEAEARALES